MKRKILIVDDEQSIADLVEVYLSNEGMDCSSSTINIFLFITFTSPVLSTVKILAQNETTVK